MVNFNWLYRVLLRFRYPVTLPEDIANDIGLPISNFLTFKEFIVQLTNSPSRPRRLRRFMPRDAAEASFKHAQRKEKFSRNSLFSYHFREGWMEFSLHFDEHSRLRRVYLQHKFLENEQGIEILLNQELCSYPIPAQV